MKQQSMRILVWGKAYPELSRRFAETVCTGGVKDDGAPIRLYPVPLRYLDGDKQYKLYDWIVVKVEKSKSDPRPESFKVQSNSIRRAGHVDPDDLGWQKRGEWIFRDPDWQFSSVGELKLAQQESRRSLGIVQPGKIEAVYLKRKPDSERQEYEADVAAIQAQRDMFLPEYKKLEYRSHEVRLKWRCQGDCFECRSDPHDMMVLDWGLIELARKNGWNWQLAKARLDEVTDLSSHDLRLFLGNFRLHPTSFTIVGLWYPKRSPQPSLF